MYKDDKRKSNSNECIYNGRKLSNVVANIKASHNVDQVCIGADDDDEFDALVEKSPKEGRIKIGLECATVLPGEMLWPEIDLEDILRFARKYCNGIYERILEEVEPYEHNQSPELTGEGQCISDRL